MGKSKKGVFRNVKSIILREHEYSILWRDRGIVADKEKVFGTCDPPFKRNKKIKIDTSVEEDEMLDTIIHEALHACYWDLDEMAVSEAADSLAQLLWDCGYRRIENPVD